MSFGFKIDLSIGSAALRAGAGGPGVQGYGYEVDENRAFLVDELGGRQIGQAAPSFSLIKDAAARRGVKFGSAVQLSAMQSDVPYKALVSQQCSIIGFENDFKPSRIQATQGVFTFSDADAAAAMAQSMGKPFRFHLLNYPAHDMAWVDDTTVTAGTWQALTDSHFEAVAARPWSQLVTSVDVSNETADPTYPDGFRRHPWYNAGGAQWLIYSFFKARELWPNTPLLLCQDLQEQYLGSGYDIFDAFLKVLDALIAAGAPIDGVNLQGHLTFARGWDAIRFRNQLQAIKDRGLIITVGEVDIRTGNTGTYVPANYTNAGRDALSATMISQYLDIITQFIDGGELLVWELGDTYNAWGVDERPCIYDASLTVKPEYYRAFFEALYRR